MATLTGTNIYGTVTFIGAVLLREEGIVSSPLKVAQLKFEGLVGETHGGITRPSCSRVSALYPLGTRIKNARQLSLVSTDELIEVAKLLETNIIEPAWLGANFALSGIANFSDIPPASRLVFDNGASIVLDTENAPCSQAAKEIAQMTGGNAPQIKTALHHKRGLVGAVEAEGSVGLGERARLFVPQARSFYIG